MAVEFLNLMRLVYDQFMHIIMFCHMMIIGALGSLDDSGRKYRIGTVVRVLITSDEEGGDVFTSVCLSVCLFVRQITEKVVNGF